MLSRRTFLAGSIALAACGPARNEVAKTIPLRALAAPRNPRYTLDRPLTDQITAASYNNFYEFTSNKDVWRRTGAFVIDPWSVEVAGLVAKPRVYSLDEILRLPREERLYRHRCVETWAMAVPWLGFPLSRLLLAASPLSSARYVRFLSVQAPAQMPAMAARPWEQWPYYEGLRLDEAMHELAFVAIGMYGHALPKQHGAPLRIVVPWKYGYKSPKSVVKIELVAEQPHTFWSDRAPQEYPFESNVDPYRPHPRWSQLTERLLGTTDVRRTRLFNGYEEVRALYQPARYIGSHVFR
ncbi:MAG TPA: protein-methionine-sulfoxide reductase catalytic subunit MsrP [Thermoanaerobaculia bacterium]|nr:protein-methionine-sulfoxide reductase catalytic subunit MsrP [Thermoanaerobaculia bacterium]